VLCFLDVLLGLIPLHLVTLGTSCNLSSGDWKLSCHLGMHSGCGKIMKHVFCRWVRIFWLISSVAAFVLVLSTHVFFLVSPFVPCGYLVADTSLTYL
jgi:hypothetical protein